MSTCPYCTETAPDGEACYQPHGDLVCTRAPGHDGPHVACAIHEHQTETWGDPVSITDRARAEAETRTDRDIEFFAVAGMATAGVRPHVARDEFRAWLAARDHLAAQEPTDAEVLAALNAQGVAVAPKMHPAPSLDYWGDKPVEAMRAALTAAREAQR